MKSWKNVRWILPLLALSSAAYAGGVQYQCTPQSTGPGLRSFEFSTKTSLFGGTIEGVFLSDPQVGTYASFAASGLLLDGTEQPLGNGLLVYHFRSGVQAQAIIVMTESSLLNDYPKQYKYPAGMIEGSLDTAKLVIDGREIYSCKLE